MIPINLSPRIRSCHHWFWFCHCCIFTATSSKFNIRFYQSWYSLSSNSFLGWSKDILLISARILKFTFILRSLKISFIFLFFVVFESICNKDINCNKRVIYLFLLFLLRKSLQCSRSAPSCTSVPHYLCCVASLCNAYMTLIMKMIFICSQLGFNNNYAWKSFVILMKGKCKLGAFSVEILHNIQGGGG